MVHLDLRVRTTNESTSAHQEVVLTVKCEEHSMSEQLIDRPSFIGAERLVHAPAGEVFSADVPLAVQILGSVEYSPMITLVFVSCLAAKV